MKRLIIIGASGHGRVVADIAQLNGYESIVFLDDNEKLISCGRYNVVGTSSRVRQLEGDIFIGIGNGQIRQRFWEQCKDRLVTLIHPNAIIASDAEIGLGTVIMAGAVVNPGCRIGKGVIVNTSSSIDHDCRIGNYVHVAVGAHLSGTVSIGNHTWLGIGAAVSNNVAICDNCIIGAGAVVVKDIREQGIYEIGRAHV